MTSISSKIFEIFRNLKSDAIPRAPRPAHEEIYEVNEDNTENNENVDTSNDAEEITVESDDDLKKEDQKKPKFKKSFFKANKKNNNNPGFSKTGKGNKGDSGSSVNTQATGNVINIVNASKIRFGNDYYMGNASKKQQTETEDSEEHVEKCNRITLLMEANIKPEHEYIDYVSKNLGKNWRTFFRTLGYSKGRIETVEIDTASYGVSEARYKLLLDWVNNEDNGTLGRLASLLWEEGERQIVKALAIMYKKNKK